MTRLRVEPKTGLATRIPTSRGVSGWQCRGREGGRGGGGRVVNHTGPPDYRDDPVLHMKKPIGGTEQRALE